jgi:hypothetical protein
LALSGLYPCDPRGISGDRSGTQEFRDLNVEIREAGTGKGGTENLELRKSGRGGRAWAFGSYSRHSRGASGDRSGDQKFRDLNVEIREAGTGKGGTENLELGKSGRGGRVWAFGRVRVIRGKRLGIALELSFQLSPSFIPPTAPPVPSFLIS